LKSNTTLTVDRVIWKKENMVGFFCIMSCSDGKKDVWGNKNEVIVKGDFLESPDKVLGEQIKFYGKWVEDPKYGRQFSFNAYDFNKGDLRYFLENMITGINKNAAKRIAELYTADELDIIIKNNAEELVNIKGIGKKSIGKIKNSWEKFRGVRKLSEFLHSFEVTNNFVLKIYYNFGEESIPRIKKNPYILTTVSGLGFKTIDDIALKMGVEELSEDRIWSGIKYVLNRVQAQEGNTYISGKSLINECIEELCVDEHRKVKSENIISVVKKMIEEDELVRVVHNNAVYTTDIRNYETERYIYKTLISISENKNIEELSARDRTTALSFFPYEPDSVQMEAISMGASNLPAFTISGYAGTGKTTVAKSVIKLMQKKNGVKDSEVHCCALSGVASNRIKEATSGVYSSSTIHSMLGYDGGEWIKNHNNPIHYKILLVDEASMIDIALWRGILDAIDFTKTRLVILGDPGQIPPVGLGEVYADILEKGILPGVVLKKIYRQNEKSTIPALARKIRDGKLPTDEDLKGDYDDFEYFDFTINNRTALKRNLGDREFRDDIVGANNIKITDNVVADYKLIMNSYNYIMDEFEDVGVRESFKRNRKLKYHRLAQVLVPMHKGETGISKMNELIQKGMAGKHGIELGQYKFNLYDKVIHLKNKNKNVIGSNGHESVERVMNGQMGIVERINKPDSKIVVYYPDEQMSVEYNKEDIVVNNTLSLAYCISIHKSQGAQFRNVLMPVIWSYYNMLEPKLLYTAITRAEKNLMMYGETDALRAGCAKREQRIRVTMPKVMTLEDIVSGIKK
jgi:exodeoxyribonuclease V alpha subunit